MRKIIFWFSGTGNSLAVARDLAAELTDTEIIPTASAIKTNIPDAECIGVVFTVKAFGMPRIVAEFLKRVPLDTNKYFFTVATYSMLAGAPHSEARQILKTRKRSLAAGWSIAMPNNYTVLAGAMSEEKQKRRFDSARNRVRDIAEIVRKGQPGPIEDSVFPLRLLGGLIHGFAARRFHLDAKKFKAGQNCTRCGICEKVCPVENITLADGRPVWGEHCEQCFACLQWCPAEAIQFGRLTAGRKRYHHPDFTAEDLFLRESKQLT